MRISDWSSDVCSSDLTKDRREDGRRRANSRPSGGDGCGSRTRPRAARPAQTIQGDKGKRPVNLPNLLTLLRIAAVPVLCVAFWLPQQAAALATFSIFALASITDWLDGYLARRLNQSSEFGRCLDPIADKVLVAAALILLASSGEMLAAAELAIVIILVREFLVSGQIGRAHV